MSDNKNILVKIEYHYANPDIVDFITGEDAEELNDLINGLINFSENHNWRRSSIIKIRKLQNKFRTRPREFLHRIAIGGLMIFALNRTEQKEKWQEVYKHLERANALMKEIEEKQQ